MSQGAPIIRAWPGRDGSTTNRGLGVIFHRGDAGTYPSHQRWFLPVSAGTYPSGQRCCAASASHSGRTKGGRDCVAEPIRLANAAAPLLLRSQARRKAYRARSAETQGTARYGSASWQVNAPLHDGCAGERGAGTGGWPARGDASVPLPRRTAPAPTRLIERVAVLMKRK